jgi:hypothetical protein
MQIGNNFFSSVGGKEDRRWGLKLINYHDDDENCAAASPTHFFVFSHLDALVCYQRRTIF